MALVTVVVFNSFDTRFPQMQDITPLSVVELEFSEIVYPSAILLTREYVTVTSQIDRVFWTTTIPERFHSDTVVVLHRLSILCIVEINAVFNTDKDDTENDDCDK